MTVIQHQTLGRLEFDGGGFAQTELKLGDRSVLTHVSFNGAPSTDVLNKVAALVANLAVLDQAARSAMRQDLASGDDDGAVKLYKSHHLEELEAPVLREIFAVDGVDDVSDPIFLRALKLIRVGIHPESDKPILCDYTISEQATNYLIAVTFDATGAVNDLSLES